MCYASNYSRICIRRSQYDVWGPPWTSMCTACLLNTLAATVHPFRTARVIIIEPMPTYDRGYG